MAWKLMWTAGAIWFAFRIWLLFGKDIEPDDTEVD